MAMEWRPSSAVHRWAHAPQASSRPNTTSIVADVVRQVVLGEEVDVEGAAHRVGQLGAAEVGVVGRPGLARHGVTPRL